MAENKVADVIDIGKLIKKIYSKRKLFLYKVWPTTFIVSCLYIICIPRYYTSEARLVPELGSSIGGGGLGSLAASFGFNLDNPEGGDAITPMLYPDLMEDNGFVANLFNIHVKSSDGEIATNYYDYLKNHQKHPWWSAVTKWIGGIVKSIIPKAEVPSPESGVGGKRSPYWLTEEEEGIANIVRNAIMLTLNDKTGVISITTKAQDPLVSKILADSVQVYLQEFITAYRTNKARVDVTHYEELTRQALEEYLRSSEEYSKFNDANKGVVMASIQTKMDNMLKDMQVKYTTYTTMTAQYESSKAKLQERTPAFTQLKGASVNVKPAGPKRMIFVILMLILSTMVTIVVIFRHDLTKIITIRNS